MFKDASSWCSFGAYEFPEWLPLHIRNKAALGMHVSNLQFRKVTCFCTTALHVEQCVEALSSYSQSSGGRAVRWKRMPSAPRMPGEPVAACLAITKCYTQNDLLHFLHAQCKSGDNVEGG